MASISKIAESLEKEVHELGTMAIAKRRLSSKRVNDTDEWALKTMVFFKSKCAMFNEDRNTEGLCHMINALMEIIEPMSRGDVSCYIDAIIVSMQYAYNNMQHIRNKLRQWKNEKKYAMWGRNAEACKDQIEQLIKPILDKQRKRKSSNPIIISTDDEDKDGNETDDFIDDEPIKEKPRKNRRLVKIKKTNPEKEEAIPVPVPVYIPAPEPEPVNNNAPAESSSAFSFDSLDKLQAMVQLTDRLKAHTKGHVSWMIKDETYQVVITKILVANVDFEIQGKKTGFVATIDPKDLEM